MGRMGRMGRMFSFFEKFLMKQIYKKFLEMPKKIPNLPKFLPKV